MLELYTLIYNIVNPICPAFDDHYPENDKKVFPYTEIKFFNALPNNSFSDSVILEIDVWDGKGTDIKEIETITDAIHKALNRLQYNDAKMNVSINRNSPYRLVLPDPIIHIQRRQLRYVVTIYNK